MASNPTTQAKGFQDHRYRTLIERLVDQRKALKLSQVELGVRLGRHQQFVSRYETGERRIDAVEFVDIARALECDPSDMIATVPPNASNPEQAKS